MKCHEVRRALDPFMDDELSVPENLAVLAHLNLCAGCASVFEGESALRQALCRQLGGEAAPPELAARWRAALRTDPAARRPHRWAAAVFLAGLTAVIILTPPGESPRVLAAELAGAHGSFRYVCGGKDSDRACVCRGCAPDPQGAARAFYAAHGCPDACVHDLQGILDGYRFSGVAVWPRRGRSVCWATWRDAEGRTLSHAFVDTPIAVGARPQRIEEDGRTFFFVPRERCPAGMCVFVFDDPAAADRFGRTLGI